MANNNKKQLFQVRRRQFLVLGVVLALCLPITIRLFDLQVVRANEIRTEANERRSIPVTTYGERGNIYDSDGNVLAQSVMRFNITASPRYSTNEFQRRDENNNRITVQREQAVKELAEITGVTEESITAALNAKPDSDFAYVAKSVDIEVLRQVQELGIPWLYSEQVPSRTYPKGAVGGNIIGFMSKDGPGAGVELYMDQCLAPVDGQETYERSRDGVRLPGSTIVTEQFENGQDVHLTLNADLQWYAQESLATGAKAAESDWATAIVLEIETGKVRAVAEYPTADPNNPSATAPETWTSRSFTSIYEPGSTMKTLTLAAAISSGAITSTTGVEVPPNYNFGNGITIKDASWHPVQKLTAAGVMANSSNVGTIFLSQKMSSKERYEYMLEAGFGSPTEAGFLGEIGGIFNGPGQWDKHTELATNYGQGLAVTSMQMAAAYQIIGNNGVKMPVTLVEGCVDDEGNVTHQQDAELQKRVFTEQAAKQTQDLLETTVNSSWLEPHLSIPGYRIGAKTGTAQVAERGIYGNKAVTSIIAMVPMENPQYVVAVTFGYPKNKSTAMVAPVVRDIMTQVLKTYKIQPADSNPVKLPTTW